MDGTTSFWADAAPPCNQKYTPVCEYVNAPCRKNADCLEDRGECFNGQCRCKKGYHGDGIEKCEDINECDESPCDSTAIDCHNEVGSYKCECPKNFLGDGTPSSPCYNPARCRNNADCNRHGFCDKDGGCVCNEGFDGDGKTTCANINECEKKTDDCDANADCEDTEGSFKCICKNGYTGNGKTCEPIPQDCHEIYEKDNDAKDGMFYIDPDFEGPLDKVRVRCIFFEGMGVTIIEHTRQQKLAIKRNRRPQSHRQYLTYKQNILLQHITTVVDHSQFCKQSIRFYCKGPLSYVENNAWLDRYDNKVLDLAGAISGAKSPTCPCGAIRACDDGPSISCNCNEGLSNRATASDYGVITDRSLLPVVGLALGGTIDGKKGWIEVGPLECGPKPFGLPKDCADAKENYRIKKDGVELIDVDGDGDIPPFYVYCNMKEWSNTPITEIPGTSGPVPADGPGFKEMPYPVPVEGLKKLAENSGFCLQEVEYTCTDSPVTGRESLDTYFSDASDNLIPNFIGVSGADENICPCGIVGFCAGEEPKCNCDIENGKNQTEFGVIIDKSKLPVTAINIGEVGKAAGYTVGRLRCGVEQFGIYGSCQELRYKGYVRSGPYFIDPDGAPKPERTNNAPFLVQCEFDKDKPIGITVLPAEEYSYPKEGTPGVTYPTATNDQISGLIDRSAYCTQEITYNCKKSRIFQNGDNKASWFSLLNDRERRYFDGDGNPDETCACGIRGDCPDDNKCTCDIYDDEDRQDNGLLRNKNHLPIGKLRFTDVGSNSTASFEIGPLKCYELFVTCEELKTNYRVNRGMPRLRKGNFVIDPDLAEDLTPGFGVYCDFPRTIVSINRRDREERTRSNTPKCYDISYGGNIVEMKLLAEKSDYCQQEVSYEAKFAPFSTQVNWTDVNGNPGVGWGGSNGAAECACGEVDRCVGGTGDKCNTDKADDTYFDKGWLIDKEVIPVTQICMSRQSNSKGAYARYKFGDFSCGPSYKDIYADCQEYRGKHVKTNEALLIDPDGTGGVAPFTVWCEMTDDPPAGVTVITSKDETCQDIPEKGGYVVVEYNAAVKEQIVALKERSVYCEQEVYYECTNADLTFDGDAGWYNQDDARMEGWAENSNGTGCAGGTCKCSTQDGNPYKDGGKLLSKDDLPVSKFNFNGIESGGKRCIRVDSLKCYDIYQDCDEILKLDKDYNINKNNRYAIDPDKAGGVEFFGATCDFRTSPSIGITIIPLDNDKDIGTVGEVKIVYEKATLDQIKSLVTKSTWCRQMLEYLCKNALLINDNNALNTYFETFDGQKSTVWAGADREFGDMVGCACVLLGTCPEKASGGNHTCKCDVQDDAERLEGGLVTNRDILPLSSVVRGELNEGAIGTVDVGDIRCAPQPFSLPKDCEEVENDGYESGEYLIWPDESVDPFLVYCDMTIKPRTGVTVIKPTKTTVEIGPGDNLISFIEASTEQVRQLVGQSKNCYQPMRILCNSFPLFDDDGNPTLTWLEQGSSVLLEQKYFGHASPADAECSCGNSNTCGGEDGKQEMQKRRCNCDIGDAADRVDAGILREKDDLPLVGFRNKDVSNGSLTVILGNLYCADSPFDLDVCDTDFQDCHVNATCVKKSNNGYVCACKEGWQGLNRPDVWANGRECYDDDECAKNPCDNSITAKCVNTPGSYYCECNEGFELSAEDKNVCKDFNECEADEHDCHSDATCINIYGSYVCACNRGFRGNGTHCEPIGECVCWGDPHCKIFDDTMYHHYGPCSYVMARDNCLNGVPMGEPTFQVDQINWRQGRTDTQGSWIHSVNVTLHGSEIILGQNKSVTVDGILVPGFSSRPLTPKGHPDVLIVQAGFYVRLTTGQGLEVRWDGKTKVDVVVASDYQNAMCGICGNFNGKPGDDFVAGSACPDTEAGTEVENINEFLTSWLAYKSHNYEVEECLAYCNKSEKPIDLCKEEGDPAQAERDCKKIFSESSEFWPCFQRIEEEFREMLYESCMVDMCAGVDKCVYAENMAELCQGTYKVTISTWRSASYCRAPSCGENMEYKTCGSMCQPNCVYPEGVPECMTECTTGCFCKKGFIMDSEKGCVKAENCGCLHMESGIYFPRDKKVLMNCSHLCECTPEGLECKDHQCAANSTCEVRDSVLDCYCHDGFEKEDVAESCKDIDECERNLDNCHEFATCTNLIPGFNCSCLEGYEGDGVNCKDIDECTIGTHDCDLITTDCENKAASFQCKCKTGFARVNRTHCEDVDECTDNRDSCDPVSTDCRNTEGKYACDCKENFIPFDDTSCEDINECNEGLDNCHENATCGNSLGTFTCVCKNGFEGNGTNCEDIEECEQGTHTCTENEYCINTIGSHNCECKEGFERTAQQVCEDIDECQKGLDNCVEESDGGVCTNIDGSFQCSCAEGYSGDGITGCSDVNECDRPGPAICGQHSNCTNLEPGYLCKCEEGYKSLTEDGANCQLIPTCENTDYECPENATCQTTDDGPTCKCNNGFERFDDKTCLDIDECQNETKHCTDENMICVNTVGGYRCDCIKGYLYSVPLHQCQDIDECTTGDFNCTENSYCSNTDGSYECICDEGYVKSNDGEDSVCDNVNECEMDPRLCDVNAVCNDTEGSYQCTCKEGYTGNGVVCNELPKCEDSPCAVHAVCTEYPGGFDCQCIKGYEGDGFNCTNIDECERGLDKCSPNSECEDTPGGYNCRCRVGFEGHCDDCWDINECDTGLHDCDTFSNCINTVGSYRCECERGYIYKYESCQDINECMLGIDDCDEDTQNCHNIVGGFQCECKKGFRKVNNGSCVDIDECKEGCPFGCSMCDEAAKCVNTPGSYTCVCNPGFTGDGRSCIADDPNRCGPDFSCDPSADCIQRSADPDDLFCVCRTGFTGSGLQGPGESGCVDVTSCAVKNPCSPPGTCVNSDFGQLCACPKGFTTVGYDCVPTDPCEDPYACPPHASCNSTSNTDFSCECDPGFELDDVTSSCRDIDECASSDTFTCPDNSECINYEGSYTCICDLGYRKSNNRTACDDIDECTEGIDNCDEESRATCINFAGGFSCECLPLFTGNGIVCLEQGIQGCPEACPQFSYCASTPDGPKCQCRDGFNQTSDDEEPLVCEDIDECELNECDSSNLVCANRLGGYDCICPLGYEGVGCSNINECDDPRTCSEFADCQDTEGSYTCTCKEGFTGDGVLCFPMSPADDPCKCGSTGICNPKTLECTCKLGYAPDYTLEVDKCQDINDCLVPGRCHPSAKCVDVVGGYYCKCPNGYRGDGVEFCTKDTCSTSEDCDENAECKMIDDVRQCVCNAGFGGNGTMCIAGLDPCESVSCPENGYCTVYDDKPLCDCLPGFQGNGEVCKDIDECVEYPPPCHETAICDNSPGTYSCKCAEGYKPLETLDGACQDIHECAEGLANCDINAECSNEIGGYTCTCRDGFTGNGFSCQPDNACEGLGGCPQNSTCARNTQGGYSCLCDSGYIMKDGTCQEANECLLNLDTCAGNERCVDTFGSYECVCLEGYEKLGSFCVDIDECAMANETKPCPESAICANSEGSYTCKCPPGFVYVDKKCIAGNACAGVTGESGKGEGDGKCPCHKDASCTNTNTDVGYECVCYPGYIGNGLECEPEDPCIYTLCEPNSRCKSSDGTAKCECIPGYKYNDDKECVNINECEKDNECSEDATCADNEGSYTCTCKPGLVGNGRVCEETDPCSESHPCDENASCASVEGSAVCICNPGFTGDGQSCTRTSYCPDADCPVQSDCSEEEGGFQCTCKPPLVGDGYNCKKVGDCTDFDEDVCGDTRYCASEIDGKAQCECQQGFAPFGESKCEGDACGYECFDIDECGVPNDCSRNANCVNKDGGYLCECKDGYKGNGINCIDVNECLEDVCGDGATCFNKNGSCVCACPEGSQPSNGPCSRCEDIDECKTGDNNCPDSAECDNAQPGYSCRCKPGFRGMTGYDCEDIDECTETPGICGLGECNNSLGGYKCDCPEGYYFDETTCSNVDECSLPAGSDGADKCVNAHCRDLTPGYECDCKAGYERESDLVCRDINECEVNPDICVPSGECINQDGSYTCTCPPGYEYNGESCVDINECGNPDVCGDRAYSVCVNFAGSYQCLCRPGYKYNGKCCEDIDECTELEEYPCDISADCANNKGGYECICQTGYEYRNNMCVDIDECTELKNPCGDWGDCENTEGSFRCTCRTGYVRSGQTCKPICDFDTCRQYQHCHVTDDEPVCSCKCSSDECVEDGPVCGSDGRTYPNMKNLLESRCEQQISVSRLYDGPCLTSCDNLDCPAEKYCQVEDGLAKCACRAKACSPGDMVDRVCTTKKKEYPRCLFYILKCLGYSRNEEIAYNGSCMHDKCVYKPWGPWEPCSVSCGLGLRTSHREVAELLYKEGLVCDEVNKTMDCVKPACPGDVCEKANQTCARPESTCVDVNGDAVCRCPVCDTEPISEVCGLINEKPKTYKNLCHFRHAACQQNAKDHQYLHDGPCNNGQNLPLRCTMLPFYTREMSRDLIPTNRCYGGCGTEVGECCLPTSVQLNPVLMDKENGFRITQYAMVTSCKCMPREERPALREKVLGYAISQGFIIPDAFHELISDGPEAESEQKP